MDDEATEQAIPVIQSDDRQASTGDEATSHEFTTSRQSPVSAIGEVRRYNKYREHYPSLPYAIRTVLGRRDNRRDAWTHCERKFFFGKFSNLRSKQP